MTKANENAMYSRRHQSTETRRRQNAPMGYGGEALRDTLLVPPEYRGEFLRRTHIPSAADVSSSESPISNEAPVNEAASAEEIEHMEAEPAPEHSARGVLSELSSLLFGRGGDEDALLILGVGLLLMNSRMERGKTPLFSGGRFHPEEDDIGLFLILLLLFS